MSHTGHQITKSKDLNVEVGGKYGYHYCLKG